MKYDVIYCDIPWAFKVWSEPTGSGRSAASHYPTLDLQAVKDLPVKDIASDDSVLFLWACNSMLPEALEVMNSWGFEFKTIAFTWVKTNKKTTDTVFWGMGYWTRQNSEYVLIGTRGKPKRASKGVHSVVWSHEEAGADLIIDDLPEALVRPVMRHSAKPPEIRNRIVELMGQDLRYVELFARQPAEGEPAIPDMWQLVGNEIDGLDIRDALPKLALQADLQGD
jgi:N6-adenosine-specific RNA methylase IME4